MKKGFCFFDLKVTLILLGFIFFVKAEAINKNPDPSKISPVHSSSEQKPSEFREPIKVHRLQDEALKKLQELIACSPSQQNLNEETLKSQIKESLSSPATKFIDQQSDDMSKKTKEKPLSIQELKGILKNEKLANYFYEVFTKLSDSKLIDDYLDRSIKLSDKQKAAQAIFDELHKKESSLSKALSEAAQEIKTQTPKSISGCKTKTKNLAKEIEEAKIKLKEAEKKAREAVIDPSRRETANNELDFHKARLESLQKTQRLEEARNLSQAINQTSEISEELSKKISIKKDLSPEEITDLSIKSEDLPNKEKVFNEAQKNYRSVSKVYDDALKADSKIDLKDTNIPYMKEQAEKELIKAKGEYDISKNADKKLKDMQRYALISKLVDDDFNILKENPGSAKAQETLKYLEKKSPSLFKDGKIRMSSNDDVKEIKKNLLEKWTQESWYKRAYNACKKMACEVLNWYTDYDAAY
jgi:hypothetical protein